MALPTRIDFFLPPLPPLPSNRPPIKEAKDTKRPAEIKRPTAAAATIITGAPSVEPAMPAVTAEPPSTVDAPRARLILTLPPLAASAPRNPALTDARATTQRLTLEQKMARALDNTLQTQVQADGTIRQRIGNQCVDQHQSRNTQVAPFDENLRQAPRSSGPTYECK